MKRAQYLIAPDERGLFAAHRAALSAHGCRRVFLIGGALGATGTLESICERQGWKIRKGKLLHYDEISGYRVEWYLGEAYQYFGNKAARTHYATRAEIERYDHIHDDAFDALENMKGNAND